MALTLGNYILEQDISTASCDDIEVAQLFAEMEVVSALLDCYNKQAVITEYASCDISEFGIFAESGDGEGESEKKDNVLKRAWTVVWGLLKKIGQMIVKLFSKVNYQDLIKKVEESDVEEYVCEKKFGFSTQYMKELFDQYEKLVTLISEDKPSCDTKTYNEILNTVKHIRENFKGGKTDGIAQSEYNIKYTKAEMVEKLSKLAEYQKNDIPNMRKLLKKFEISGAKDMALPESGKEAFPVLKECAKEMHSLYVDMSNSVMRITKSIVKTHTKKAKNVNEYYTDDVVQEMTIIQGAILGSALGTAIGTIAGNIIAKITVKKLTGAPDKLLRAIKDTMVILEGGDDKLKRNLKDFNNNLNKIKTELAWAKQSIATLTLRENKKLNEIAKDLEEYIDVVLRITEGIFAKKRIDKDKFRIGDRIKEMAEECQKIVEFFADHPVHGDKKTDEE